MVVGEDVAIRADDDAGTEAELAFVLRAVVVAEEAAEQRVVAERVRLLLGRLGGEDVYHRGHRALRCSAVGVQCRRGGAVGLAYRHSCGLQLNLAGGACKPLRFEGRYNEPQGERNGNGLREQ